MSPPKDQNGTSTYKITLSGSEASRVHAYATEREFSEKEMIEAMVSDYITLDEEGWLALRENPEGEDLTSFRMLYQGRKARNFLLVLTAVYLVLTISTLSILLVAIPGGPLRFLELVATVGFLIVSVLVALIFIVLLQTPFPEYLEQRYL